MIFRPMGAFLEIKYFSIILALIIGGIIFFAFMNKDNEKKLSGSLKAFYSFLNFNSFIFENVIKFIYVIVACFLTIYGLCLLFIYPSIALIILIFGNIALRLVLEFFMAIFRIKDSKCSFDTFECIDDIDEIEITSDDEDTNVDNQEDNVEKVEAEVVEEKSKK